MKTSFIKTGKNLLKKAQWQKFVAFFSLVVLVHVFVPGSAEAKVSDIFSNITSEFPVIFTFFQLGAALGGFVMVIVGLFMFFNKDKTQTTGGKIFGYIGVGALLMGAVAFSTEGLDSLFGDTDGATSAFEELMSD